MLIGNDAGSVTGNAPGEKLIIPSLCPKPGSQVLVSATLESVTWDLRGDGFVVQLPASFEPDPLGIPVVRFEKASD